jgi:HEAT repeat protein
MRRAPVVAPALVVVAALLALLPSCRKKAGPPDVAGLIAELESPDVQKRGQARLTLIALGEQAAPALAGMLRSGRPEQRLAAANIIWGMGPRGRIAVPELAQALDDGDPGLQLAAAMAVENIGPGAEAAVPALVRALSERRDRRVRQTAAKALGAIGPGAREALPALTRELRRESWPEAEEAVRRIRGLAPGAPIGLSEASPR